MKKTQVVIILGPPGSGKGTQANLLAEKFGFFHLETSKIIEAKLASAKRNSFVLVQGKKYYLIEELKKREKGELMSPPLIISWLKKRIQELGREGEKIVLSGSPRTLPEGEELSPFIRKIYSKKNIKVILLELSDNQSVKRNVSRRVCKLLYHPILSTKETKNLTKCPFDGSKLLNRKDDNEKIIRLRLQRYRDRTFPLVAIFKKQGFDISKINGDKPVVDVFNAICKSLK
ncbi:MAG: Adenylate kinase [Parcubacteria group bacterium GW2011_GWC1_38_6]|nr:MAG: Adenylate kinase [Parcubacteria group bacterium GW2011_GWA1_36_12]KKQ77311.1 MAG: Adenylate kinase [Parcubacteria group bacterium GW2011_GWC1_38_6]